MIGGHFSIDAKIASSVPQGSVLGPLLFLIYKNNIPNCVQNSVCRLFADDCITYKQIRSCHDSSHDYVLLCTVFHKLVPMTLQNKFSMSPSKKYKSNLYVIFARTRKKQFSITIKGVSLWNSLHNFVKLSSSLRIYEINLTKSFLGKY